MTNSKQTKKALFSSVIALILCFSMLIGTTFAWFTDAVESGLNEIRAGNLDVNLEYWNGKDWATVEGEDDLFGDALWEPGHTEVVYLKVSNLGSLALKYKLGITVAEEYTSLTEKGEVIKLSDHIQFGIVADKKGEDAYENRNDAIADLNGSELPIGTSYASSDVALYPVDSELGQPSEAYLALVVFMPETVGNEANHATGVEAPYIQLGISLYATQLEAESDSFGSNYDEHAKYDADLWDGTAAYDWYFDAEDGVGDTAENPYVLESASDLAGLVQLVNGTAASTYSLRSTAVQDTFAGKYLVLDADINLNNMNWTPIGLDADSTTKFQGTFDGQGHTIFDLMVRPAPGYTAAGLFGVVNGTVKNLNIVGATVEHISTGTATDNGIAVVAGSVYTGGENGNAGTIDNVSVKNATVKGNRYMGTVVGYCYGSVTNCSVENVTLVAEPNLVGENEYDNGDKVGGLVGYYAASASVITGNTIANVSVKGYRDLAVVVGASYAAETVQNNTISDVQLAVDQATGSYGVKDANAGIVVGRLLGGTLGENKVEGEVSLTLTGSLKAMTVPTEVDTLILKDLTITASEGSALILPAEFAGKVVVEGKNTLTGASGGHGIYAEGALDLSGTGSLTVVGNAGVDDDNGGSGIGGEGTINIHDLAELTAKGYGKAGFGIGGASASITITHTNIAYACGGYVQPNFINDTSYGKTEPEGGAAIGSSTKGAVITLNDVVIENAQGGSKAAGIGARYHTGVTINIKNSTIKNVEGGNASAGIGGSRVSDDIAPADQHVLINIENSTIKAIGGEFGAGIGSGYDTHCGEKDKQAFITETICTINIDAASNITAQGGKYAAGVGTGYHVAALAGNIQCKVDATAGESREKYTVAQAVGFGVVDHDREVSYLTTAPSIAYQGVVIGVPGVQVSDSGELDSILQEGGDVTLSTDMEVSADDTTANNGYGATGVSVKGGVLDGNGNVLTVEDANDTWDCAVHVTSGTIKNLTVKGAFRGIFMGSANGDVYIDNVVFDDVVYTFNSDGGSKEYGVYISNSTLNGWTSWSNVHKEIMFTNCKFGEGCGNAFINAHQSVTFTNCEFAEGFEVNPANTSTYLTFVNCTYNGVLITNENVTDVLYAASDAYLCIVNNT